ncbi:MAG: hypothetical protein AAF236_14470 [Verrucomicrobiota bacterium]
MTKRKQFQSCPLISIGFFLIAAQSCFAQAAESTLKSLSTPSEWGQIEWTPFYLEVPEDILRLSSIPSETTIWHLPDRSADEIEDLLLELGMAQDAVEQTLAASLPYQLNPPYRLFPPREVVLSLPSEARSKLYAVLARYPENAMHRQPTVLPEGDLARFFAGTDLSPEQMKLIAQLSYERLSQRCFADLPALLWTTKSEAEEWNLLRMMTRVRTYLGRVRLMPEQDLGSFVDYWTWDFRQTDGVPFLDTFTRDGLAEGIDLTEILPPVPRKFVYTFPREEMGAEGAFPDSYWAALNFFLYLPRDEFSDSAEAAAELEQWYEPVDQPPRYGDVLIFRPTDSERATVASAYLADGMVYTKPSRARRFPFVLMRIEELVNQLGGTDEVSISVFRQREGP